MNDNNIPRSNYVWKETTRVSGRAASYFVKGIFIILGSAVSREFVF